MACEDGFESILFALVREQGWFRWFYHAEAEVKVGKSRGMGRSHLCSGAWAMHQCATAGELVREGGITIPLET